MSMEETHQFDWYLVAETRLARCFSESADGSDPTWWVPRSLIRDFLKYPPKSPMQKPLCLVEIPEWFAMKENLL